MNHAPHTPTRVEKPWGHEVWFANTPQYLGKVLYVKAGGRTSLQKHATKRESLYMLSGRAKLFVDDREYDWTPERAIEIAPGIVHRFEAVEDTVLVEVATPHPDDLIRIGDDYGRVPTP